MECTVDATENWSIMILKTFSINKEELIEYLVGRIQDRFENPKQENPNLSSIKRELCKHGKSPLLLS